RMVAECARRLGQDARAAILDEQAEALRVRFEESFWCDELGTYAIALDGNKAPCRVRTSNAGHLLLAGIARSDRARHVASGLFRPPFYSGWGIRTVAQGEARYNPMSYHNGSIWPHDNALIGLGLGRYGYRHCVGTIFQGLIAATSYMDDRRIPELFCGFRRRTGRGPTLYPAACSPQAWAAAAPFLLVKSMLGLSFEPERRCIRLVRPRLPELVGDVTVRNLSLGGASADFTLHRQGARVALELLRTDSDLAITLDAKSE
ncbi:MAG TPA: amylo-alpha-1,6-glucosidase, partial [Hyphomicrobiaceae bacterium]|nr:amylo-alpha-1,6-glucosidase [Hyphomicrobiaceae bacterium]